MPRLHLATGSHIRSVSGSPTALSPRSIFCQPHPTAPSQIRQSSSQRSVGSMHETRLTTAAIVTAPRYAAAGSHGAQWHVRDQLQHPGRRILARRSSCRARGSRPSVSARKGMLYARSAFLTGRGPAVSAPSPAGCRRRGVSCNSLEGAGDGSLVPLGLDFLTFLASTVLVIPLFKSVKASPILGCDQSHHPLHGCSREYPHPVI